MTEQTSQENYKVLRRVSCTSAPVQTKRFKKDLLLKVRGEESQKLRKYEDRESHHVLVHKDAQVILSDIDGHAGIIEGHLSQEISKEGTW